MATRTATNNLVAIRDDLIRAGYNTDPVTLEFDRLVLGRTPSIHFRNTLRAAVLINDVDYNLYEKRRFGKTIFTDVKITGEAADLLPIVRILLADGAHCDRSHCGRLMFP